MILQIISPASEENPILQKMGKTSKFSLRYLLIPILGHSECSLFRENWKEC